jgi:DNA-directed RNA polymerase sigma subunit (sigma70/sigma32)
VKARKVIKIAKELLSLETPIEDEENGHLSDFIEGQGPLENWISVSLRSKTGPTGAVATP